MAMSLSLGWRAAPRANEPNNHTSASCSPNAASTIRRNPSIARLRGAFTAVLAQSDRPMLSLEPQIPTRQQQEAHMPAYFVAEVDVTNPAGYEPYRAAVPATLAQYGGRYLTRGGAAELIEGGPEPRRVVILEFADVAAGEGLDGSPGHHKKFPTPPAHS